MNSRNANTELPNDEQLVAYLDGELDAAVARQIEARLADDHALRDRLRELDGTWQLLGQLETNAAGHDFTRTTLELVAAAQEAEREVATAPSRRLGRALLAVGALLLSGVVGFLVVAAVRPDPNRRLLEDLPILENLETFRAVDDFEFLSALHQAKLFQEETAAKEGQPESAMGLDSPEAVRSRIEAMTPKEKEQLRKRQDQFAALESAEQDRLHRLYDNLAAAPDSGALRAVADRYYDWLKALPPISRAELVELSLEQRVQRVKSLLARQAAERFERLGTDESRVLAAWLAGLTDRMTEALPEPFRARIRQEPDPQRRRTALLMTLQTTRLPDGARRSMDQVLNDDDLADLRAKLPERTRLELERHPTAEQWRIVKGWIPQLMRHRWTGRGPRGPFPSTEEQGLAEFFENELEDADFDRLLALPAEEMQHELQRLYFQRGKGSPPSGFRRPGLPGHGSRPGSRPPDDNEPPPGPPPGMPDRDRPRGDARP